MLDSDEVSLLIGLALSGVMTFLIMKVLAEYAKELGRKNMERLAGIKAETRKNLKSKSMEWLLAELTRHETIDKSRDNYNLDLRRTIEKLQKEL